MPIWKDFQRTIDAPYDWRIHEPALVDIFEGRNRYFAIYGLKMAERESGEWKAYMSQQRKLLERNRHITDLQRQQRISQLSASAALPTGSTDFLALSAGRARQIMLLTDRIDPTCEVFPAERCRMRWQSSMNPDIILSFTMECGEQAISTQTETQPCGPKKFIRVPSRLLLKPEQGDGEENRVPAHQ